MLHGNNTKVCHVSSGKRTWHIKNALEIHVSTLHYGSSYRPAIVEQECNRSQGKASENTPGNTFGHFEDVMLFRGNILIGIYNRS